MAERTEKIELNIDGKTFPLEVTQSEKILMSGLDKTLNAKIKEFQSQYSNLSKEDTFSMVMISVAFECEKAKKQLDSLEKSMVHIENALNS